MVEKIHHLNQENISVSFLAICETWLKEHISDAQLNINGYNIYRSDRTVTKNGGVMLYIHNSIIIDSFSSFNDDICSAVACLSRTSNCIIFSIYRPPIASLNSFSDLINFLDKFINKFNVLDKLQIFLFGDFNFPKILWNNNSITEYVSPSEICLKILIDKFFLTQYVHQNTRESNTLDLFFTNDPNFVEHICVEDISYSDHRLVEIYTSFFSSNNLASYKNDLNSPVDAGNAGLDFSKINLNSTDFGQVNLEICKINWDNVLSDSNSIQILPEILNQTVFTALLRHSKLYNKNSQKSKTRFSRSRSIINRKIQKCKKLLSFSNYRGTKGKALTCKINKLNNDKKLSFYN